MESENSIGREIVDTLRDKKVQEGLIAILQGELSISNPCIGAVLNAFKEIFVIANEAKLRHILNGLSSGLNVEMFTNELSLYVTKDEDNAFNIANTLRKAMLSDSRIACVLMGRILADHTSSGKKYDYADKVVVHALENAIDEDIIIFRKMVNEQDENGLIKIKSEYDMCIDWCISNRLCRMENDIKDGLLNLNSSVRINESSLRLFKYIDEVKQIFRNEF